MRLLLSEMKYVTWKKFPWKIITKISSKIYNLKQFFAHEHKIPKNKFLKCKIIARIFRNKAMSWFFTGAPSGRRFCRKSNEMHEFSFASTSSVIHVTRCICFLFSVCIVWISLVVVVVVAVFFSPILSFSLADNFAVNAMFICCSILPYGVTTVSHWTKWIRFMCFFFFRLKSLAFSLFSKRNNGNCNPCDLYAIISPVNYLFFCFSIFCFSVSIWWEYGKERKTNEANNNSTYFRCAGKTMNGFSIFPRIFHATHYSVPNRILMCSHQKSGGEPEIEKIECENSGCLWIVNLLFTNIFHRILDSSSSVGQLISLPFSRCEFFFLIKIHTKHLR